MLKRSSLLVLATVVFTFQMLVGSAFAVELDKDTRTVKKNEAGDTMVLSIKQVQQGKRLFVNTCSQCHPGGITKTNPNVGLEAEALALATPPRDNVDALVDYLKDPTSYDGEFSIAEFHPSLKSADIFTEMRNLSEDDLAAIAGYILIQPKVQGIKWGGGKIYF